VVVGPTAGETVHARLCDCQFARLSVVPVIVARTIIELAPAGGLGLSAAMEIDTGGTVMMHCPNLLVFAVLVARTVKVP
jgi:hypothetical protein